MPHERLYRVTAMGRPLEPSYPTNRAVLFLLPVAAAVAGAVAGLTGAGVESVAGAALGAAAAAFGGWALGRELAPDHDPSAFISMALAFLAYVVLDQVSLLLLFTALVLARMVARTVGPPAKLTDAIAVLGLTLWAAWDIQSPLLPVVGAVAFMLDAFMQDGARRQLGFSVLALMGAVAVLLLMNGDLEPDTQAIPLWAGAVVGVVSVGYGLAIARTRQVRSVADATGTPLSVRRVRAGMAIGFLVAIQALALGMDGIELSALVWATLAGVASRW